MARDRLVWGRLASVGRLGTPTLAILVTAAAMIATLLFLDVAAIAKLASAFQLLLFSFLCLAVIIMRESGIEAYDPGFRAPLFPWLQIFGIFGPLWLITEMGELAVLFTIGVAALAIVWYFYFVRGRVPREGAIYHAFARLGERRYEGLDSELSDIVRELGLRPDDPFDMVVARAQVIDVAGEPSFRELAGRAAGLLSDRTGLPAGDLQRAYVEEAEAGGTPVAGGVALPHVRADGVEEPELVLFRSRRGLWLHGGNLSWSEGTTHGPQEEGEPGTGVHAVFFLLSPESRPGQHLRLLGHLAMHVDDEDFIDEWLAARGVAELKEILLRERRPG
jgi:mannitol/fructose-specific phosphotransferase system IIA component (Ntr-type)